MYLGTDNLLQYLHLLLNAVFTEEVLGQLGSSSLTLITAHLSHTGAGDCSQSSEQKKSSVVHDDGHEQVR